MIRSVIMAALLAAPLATPLAAQDGPRAIALVQAPEQSGGLGLGATIQEAITDGIAQCIDGGAYPGDCYVTAACDPMFWSIDIFAQHQAGNHWHESACGLPSREVAEAVAAEICNRELRPELIECALVQVWDPDGNPQMEW